MLAFRASIWGVGALALATIACRVESDDCGTQYLCETSCPCGQRCVGGHCVPPDGGAPIDAGTDARIDGGGATDAGRDSGPDAGVCELAAQAGDNDRCVDAIALREEDLASGVVVYGDTTSYGGDITPGAPAKHCTGLAQPGRDAVYRIDLTSGGTLHVHLEALGWDAGAYLLDGCEMLSDCLGGRDLDNQAVETFDVAITGAGTYFLVVDSNDVGGGGCFTLEVSKP